MAGLRSESLHSSFRKRLYEIADSGSDKANKGSERADFGSSRLYFGSKRVDKGSERDDLGCGGLI